MDDRLRHLQRHRDRGDLNQVQWLSILRRAGHPYTDELLHYWSFLVSSTENLSVTDEFILLTQVVELLRAFPLRCTCYLCYRRVEPISSRAPVLQFCECCITGVCVPANPQLPCPECRGGCKANFGDSLWVSPGTLALEIDPPQNWKTLSDPRDQMLVRSRPLCRGYHYEGTSDPDEAQYERGSTRSSSTFNKLVFIVRHAACRYEPDVQDEDDQTREWRNLLDSLGPGEFPPG